MILDFSWVCDYQHKTLGMTIWWSKNLTLPLLFFCSWLCVKNNIEISLTNVSKSSDVQVCIKLLKSLWFNLSVNKKTNVIKFSHLNTHISNIIDAELYKSARSSILSIWLLLSFFDKVVLPNKTWWCKIWWDRKNDIHYDFFEKVWYKITQNDDSIVITKGDFVNNLIYKLPVKSTTVSENILLYLILNIERFKSVNIENFYYERPEILELFRFCKICWYEVEYGYWCLNRVTTNQKYENIKKFTFSVMSDFDELLFYVFLWVTSWIKVKISNYNNNYPYAELKFIKKYLWNIISHNCNHKKQVIISPKNIVLKNVNKIDVIADAYPSIMSDSQPLLSLISIFYPNVYILDQRFKNRFWYNVYYNDFWYETAVINWGVLIKNGYLKNINPKSEYYLFSIRESAVLLLLAMHNQCKILVDSMDILERGYWNIISNLKKIWVKIN